VTLLSAWALAGLVLLAPLVVLHLRRARLPRREVPSLLLWRTLPADPSLHRRRLRTPPLPLLLLLQALALIVLVLALARPGATADAGAAVHVYVVDDSVWMQARDGGATRLAAARDQLRTRLARLGRQAPVRIVLAAASPTVLYSGRAGDAAGAVAHVAPSDGPGDLAAAVRLAAGLRRRTSDPVVLLRAPENALPRVVAPSSSFTPVAVGSAIDDQAIVEASARCGLPADDACEGFARVRNTGPRAVEARISVLDHGTPASATSVRVGPGASAPVAFHVPAGAQLELRLPGGDALAADDRAWIVVPPAAPPLRITLVGDPATALPLASALGAVAGARVRLRTANTYRASDARASDLVVLDGALPRDVLPASAGVFLVAPPRLPGGAVTGALTDARVTAVDAASPLLSDVDLTSLAVDPRTVGRLRLPSWMTPLVTAPGGPLLAAGAHGGQRVAVLAFDPAGSSLPQLASFPILIADVAGWTQEWMPAAGVAGTPQLVERPPGSGATTVRDGARLVRRLPAGRGTAALTLPRPGIYLATQRRPAGSRSRAIAINVAPSVTATGPPIDLARGAAEPPASAQRSSWAPWLLLVGLLALVAEWLYARREPRSAGV
jgi:hypothetical protein